MGPRPAPTQSATRASPSGRGRLETYTPQPSAVTKTHPTARPGVRTARDQGRREISVRKTTARPLQRSCASYASVREGLEAGPHPGAGVSVPDPFSRAPSSSYRRYFCTTGETWACPCERSARISSLDLLSLLQRSTGVGSLADLWQQMLQLGPHLQGRAARLTDTSSGSRSPGQGTRQPEDVDLWAAQRAGAGGDDAVDDPGERASCIVEVNLGGEHRGDQRARRCSHLQRKTRAPSRPAIFAAPDLETAHTSGAVLASSSSAPRRP